MLSLAAVAWPISALRLMDSAKPAGLSDAVTSCEPVESRASEALSALVDLLRLLAALSAAMFVFITINQLSSSSHPLRGVFTVRRSLPGGEFGLRASPVFPIGCLWLPIAN